MKPGAGLGHLRQVCVGSLNPPKLAGVRAALVPFAPAAQIQGVAAPSGVPEQPVGFEEIVSGARNRATAARGTVAPTARMTPSSWVTEPPAACTAADAERTSAA